MTGIEIVVLVLAALTLIVATGKVLDMRRGGSGVPDLDEVRKSHYENLDGVYRPGRTLR